MTDRLYYTDPHRIQFDATVTAVEVSNGRPAVRLDRTAFYPTSGGQPHDVGSLGGARVVDVADSPDGDVLHIIEGELQAGARVAGSVEEIRRWSKSRWAWGVMLYAPYGVPLDHPDFEPIWDAAEDLGMAAFAHVGFARERINAGWANNGRDGAFEILR